MKKFILATLLFFASLGAAFATPGCTVLGGWPGAQYGLQGQILTDSLPCYGITGTRGGPVVLQGSPTVTTPNFTTSFSVDTHIFGSHATNYHQIFDNVGNIGLAIGNATDPTSYNSNDVHTFRSKSTATNFANISASGIGVYGSSSGLPHIQAQAVAGTPTLTLPNASGTFAVSASTPLTLNATTGALTCATCTTSAASLTANQLVIGSGTQGEQTLGSLGTTTTVLHGNAAGAPTFASVTGSDMAANTVANGQLATMANGTIKCRTTAGTGSPEDCTAAQVTTILERGTTLLAVLTASNSATLSDTTHVNSTYDDYMLTFDNMVPVNNGVDLYCQVHSGGIFQSTTYLNGTGAATTQITLSVNASLVANNPGIGLSGTMYLRNVNSTTVVKFMDGRNYHYTPAAGIAAVNPVGFWNGGQGAVDGFQCAFGTGNISTGNIKLYGLRPAL